jgi:tetratricopeptide (TPR) repeat protein
LAVRHQQTGQLDQARQLCLQILQADPRHVDALHMLGLIALQIGKIELACDYISRAVQINPDFAELHNNLGTALRLQGKTSEAIVRWRQAVQLKPNFPEAYNNLGLALSEEGLLDEGIASFQQALRLRPNYAEAQNSLASLFSQQGKLEEEAACYQEATPIKPAAVHLGSPPAVLAEPNDAAVADRLMARIALDIAESFNKTGNALYAQRKLDEAAASYREALRHKPDFAEAHSNLGAVLCEQGELEAAVAAGRQALRYKPDFVAALSNLGTALYKQGKLDEAAACYREALYFGPNYTAAHFNLGIALDDQGMLDEAIASYQAALRLKPDYGDAHKNLGMAWLLTGNFEQGWPEYEWRWKTDIATPNFRQPLWDGSPLQGRTILLHTEQGAGDTLQFVRYAALVKQRGGKPWVLCPRSLVRLLSGCPGVEGLAAQGESLPDFDVHAPLMSLPGILGTTLATIPATVPYLFADGGLIDHWRRELGGHQVCKIGIAWKGSSSYRRDAERSIPLQHFAPIARLDGVKLFSLQKGLGSEQLSAVADRMAVTDLGRELDETTGAFMDTAAVMKNLDLVITSDTAIAHLAGALGVPVWVGLCFLPEWRWLLQRDDSPWYPTMRLFRQTEPGNWRGVFERMASELPKAYRQAGRAGLSPDRARTFPV